MSKIIKYCPKCFKDPYKYAEEIHNIVGLDIQSIIDNDSVGYYKINSEQEREFCKYHPEEKLVLSNLSIDEFCLLEKVSCRLDFIRSMENLKQSDPIEFQLKMSQFRANLSQTQSAKEDTNKVKCPKCGSTQITTGARGVNHFWGLIGASKTVNRCAKCGHTWKP